MKMIRFVVAVSVSVLLSSCGGGTAEPTDDAASWPMTPMLGTWSGTMTRDPDKTCGYGDAPDYSQTLTISSTDGVTFMVAFTNPALPPGAWTLEWTGEPAFDIHHSTMREFWYWDFKMVETGRAELRYRHLVTPYSAAACMSETWLGVLTRAD